MHKRMDVRMRTKFGDEQQIGEKVEQEETGRGIERDTEEARRVGYENDEGTRVDGGWMVLNITFSENFVHVRQSIYSIHTMTILRSHALIKGCEIQWTHSGLGI